MWPFRRRETSHAPAAPVHRAGPADWRLLPPIATVQTAPIRTLDNGFEEALATRHSPLFLEPLGHHLVPDGPSGRVAAAAVPGTARQYAPSPALHRQTASFAGSEPAPAAPPPTSLSPTVGDDDVADGRSREELAEPTDGTSAAAAAPAAAPAAVPTIGAVVARAPVAPGAAVVPARPVARLPLTVAPAPMLPAVPVAPVAPPPQATPDLDVGAPESSTATPAPGDTAPTVPAAAPDEPTLEPAVVDLVGGTPRPAAEPDAPSAPTAAPLQRAVSAPTSPAPPSEPSPPAASIGARAAADTPAARDVTEPDGAGRDEPATTPTVARMRTVLGPPLTERPPSTTGGALQREPLGSPPVASPAPVESTIQRAAAVTPEPTASTEPAPSSPPTSPPTPFADEAPARVATPPMLPTLGLPALDARPTHRDPAVPDGGAPHAAMPDLTAFDTTAPLARDDGPAVASRPTLAGEWLPTVARRPLDASAPVERGAAAAAPRPLEPMVVHASARAADALGPAPAAPRIASAPSSARAPSALSVPSAATTPGVAQRTMIGPPLTPIQRSLLAPAASPAAAPPAPSAAPAVGVPVDDGGGDAADPITEWPPVQRMPADEASASDVPVVARAEPVTATATSGPAAPDAGHAAPRTDAEVDELLRALYPPLRRRLCRDLLIDRERAGYGTDIRF